MTDDRAGTKSAEQYQPMRRIPPAARLFERGNTPSVYSERSEPIAAASERTDPPYTDIIVGYRTIYFRVAILKTGFWDEYARLWPSNAVPFWPASTAAPPRLQIPIFATLERLMSSVRRS